MYGIFDIALDCDIPLPELPEVETANGIIRVQAGIDTSGIPEHPEWFHHWKTQDGEVCISCAKLDDSYLLRFPKLVDFIISDNGNTIHYFSQSVSPAETIRHLLLDQVIPRILGQRGQMVLHAAAVVLPEGHVIAFLGGSGKGKSTLASSFHRNGAKLISDDCLLLKERKNQVVAIPNYYGLRLFADSAVAIFGRQLVYSPLAHYTEKNRLQLTEPGRSEFETDFRLRTIFLLADYAEDSNQETILVNPVRGAAEFMAMIEQTFLLDVADKLLVARQFRRMGKLISSGIKIYQLVYPRKHSMLPLVRSSIKEIL